MDLKVTENQKFYALLFIAYLIVSLLVFWPVTVNIFASVVNGGGDVFQSLWNLWWTPHAIFSLHQSPYHTALLFAPLGANLVTETLTPIAGILSVPFQLISLPFAYNVLFFTSFAFSGLFMYMLAHYITKSRNGSVLAGLIYAFSPMHIAQSYSHLNWTIVEFIPLFILFFIMALKEKNWKYSLYAGISFVLLTFMGDIEQGLVIAVFVIVSIVVMLLIERRELLSRQALKSLVLIAIFALVIGSPFYYWIYRGLNSSTLQTAHQLSGITNNMLYSDNLLSYFLPSYYNGIFNSVSKSYFNSIYGLTYQGITYQTDVSEKVSYAGYAVLLLVLYGLYHDYKKDRLKSSLYWIAIGIVFFLLSLGPYIQISSSVTGVPSLYILYRDIPIFNIVREPGRFDIIVTVVLGILAAFGFDAISKKVRVTNNNLALGFALVIMLEYSALPLSASFANSLITNAQLPPHLSELSNAQGNFSVLMLPALPNLATGSNLYPGMEMYYSTATGKALVGGYTTRVNTTQQLSIEGIPLASSAGYLQVGDGLVYPYPILENYSKLTLFWLYLYKTSYVGVIGGAYTPQEEAYLLSYLNSIFGAPVYQEDNFSLFSTYNATSELGSEPISYIDGTWVPGYEICYYSSYQCSNETEQQWWGTDPRAITIWDTASHNYTIDFVSQSPYPQTTLYLYLNNAQKPAYAVNLTTSDQSYNATLYMPQGINLLLFYASSRSTQISNSTYLGFGIKNITIFNKIPVIPVNAIAISGNSGGASGSSGINSTG